jgi:hypothetical protein
LSAALLGCRAEAAGVRTIKVSDAREFLEALGSNRIIEMEYWGDYNLTEINYRSLTYQEGVGWSQVFDGEELVLSGVENLTIRGGGPEGAKADIIVDPRYAFVLKFENCKNIVIEDVRAGHSEAGTCGGGVFGFENSSHITITGSEMYGCGTEGLALWNVDSVRVADSVIYECTYHIMTVEGGQNISFENCFFRENREFDLVNVSDTKNMSFTNCTFSRNNCHGTYGYYNMFNVTGTTISVTDCIFVDNVTGEPIRDSANVIFSNCTFE